MAEPDPTVLNLLEKQINTLGDNLNVRLTTTENNLGRRLDDQDKKLDRIEAQTTRTNGRVTALEGARQRAEGVMFAFSWVPAAMTAILGAGLTILIMALTGGLH